MCRLQLDVVCEGEILHLDHPRILRHNNLDRSIRSDHPRRRKHDPVAEIVPCIVLVLAAVELPVAAVVVVAAAVAVIVVEQLYLSNSNIHT